jgi:hypothetical protein
LRARSRWVSDPIIEEVQRHLLEVRVVRSGCGAIESIREFATHAPPNEIIAGSDRRGSCWRARSPAVRM